MNLLKNGNFEGGWYNLDGIPELQIPNGWQFGYADETFENPYDANPWAKFLRPEVRALPREQLPPWEQSLFILDGDYCLKPFKGSGSLWFWFFQDVNLPAGEYELTINVYPDVVMDYDEDDQKVFADDPNAALIRFNSTDHWQSINPVPSPLADSRLQTIRHKFTAPGGIHTVRVEFMLPFPLPQNGIFADRWELVAVGEPEPPTPEPTSGSKLGTHSILVGDTLDLLRYWMCAGDGPQVIKAVSNFGWLAEARQICPDAVIIGRIASSLEGAGALNDPNSDIGQMAQELMGLITNQPDWVLDLVDYWEPVNEPLGGGTPAAVYVRLAQLMIHCMEIANKENLKLGLFAFNAGCPEWVDMEAMAETGVFAMAQRDGHIITTHEGVFDDQDIDHWFGDIIPGAPYVPGAGALCFRYRYLYHLLEQRGEVAPLVVSEFRMNGAGDDLPTEEIVRRWVWYDERARADEYMRAALPFTLGPTGDWDDHNYGPYYKALIDYAVSVEGEPVEPPESGWGKPRVQYERTYVLLPPDGDADMVMEIARRFFDANRFTLGGSADDAGIGDLDARNVVAVQPDQWGDDLQAFFEMYYPGVNYLPAVGGNLTQVMGRIHASLLRARGVRFVYPSTHQPPLITSEFGEDRGEYIHTGLDIRSSWDAYGDEILCAYPGTVVHVGYNELKVWAGYYVEILSVLPDGQKMITRHAHLVDGGAYVKAAQAVKAGDKLGRPDNTGNSTGDHLHIDVRIGNEYADPAILIDWDSTPEPPITAKAVIGLHDDAGGEWMRNNGLTGYVLAHRPIHETAQPVDFTALKQNVIMRWNYDYGGVGTFPPTALTDQWVAAMVASINNSQGVYLHTIGNEWNNPVEWVGGYPNPREVLTPARVLSLYDRIAAQVRSDVLLAPGAVDPFNVVAQEFGQPGDPKKWFDMMHNGVDRIDAILLHAKTQTNDPAECSSDAEFTDAPLTGRYLHLRTYLDQLGWVKDSLRGLPVFLTEVNPQRIDATRLGWLPDNAAWISAAVAEIDRYNSTGGQPVTGVCFYRWEADDWRLQDKPLLLGEIMKQAKR